MNHHTQNVKVVFAIRDIKKGEEITISYSYFNNFKKYRTPEEHWKKLKLSYGIVCPIDCICRDNKIRELVKRAVVLDEQIGKQITQFDCVGAIKGVEEMLKLEELIGSSWTEINSTLYDGFQACLMDKRYLKKASEFKKRYQEIDSAIFGGNNTFDSCAPYFRDYTSHPLYLAKERMKDIKIFTK